MKNLVRLFIFSALYFLTQNASLAVKADSAEDQRILAKGPIPVGQWVPGGIVGTLVGFGIGHAIMGQYGEKGWIFTATEAPAYATLLTGLIMISTRGRDSTTAREDPSAAAITLTAVGAVAYAGLRIWETVDVWVNPHDHNRRYWELKNGTKKSENDHQFYITPSLTADGGWGVMTGFTF